MKKNIVLICAAVMLALCFSVPNAFTIKEKCIALSMLWDGDNSTQDMIVWLDSEGWFEVVQGEGCCGEWTEYGGSFMMQFYEGC